MTTERNLRQVALRATAAAAGLYLTVGMGWLVAWPDDRPLVGVVRVAALVVGWLGVYGVVRERSVVVEVSAMGLAVLGFWQPVAWVVVLPTGAALAVAAAVLARGERDGDDGTTNDGDGDDGATDDAEDPPSDGEPAGGE